MRVFIASDIKLEIYGDRIYAKSQYSAILERYANCFGKLILYCRFSYVDLIGKDSKEITDVVDKIIFTDSLYKPFIGINSCVVKEFMAQCDLVIGRCPSIFAYRAFEYSKELRKAFFAESMGCAWDAYWNHSVLGKLIAPYMFYKMKSVVKNADYSLYVTSKYLQRLYPNDKLSVGVSNVKISNVDNKVLDKRLCKIRSHSLLKISLATTADVSLRSKGQEFVVRAIPYLNKRNIKVKYTLIGGGDTTYLKNIALKLGVLDQVVFVGRKSLDEVFSLLDEADIYIQPSLQEGLPRSVIEAMSRGCPCIGARTAGIPELIPEECVVERKAVKQIASTIETMLNNGLEKYAIRNFEESKLYTEEVLNERRNKYFDYVKKDLGIK